jgi:tetraacyldisaccharide 4'-kinase
LNRLPRIAELPLWPAACLYEAAMRFRGLTFDLGWRSRLTTDRPVLSIGNLTAGGTGKTPLVALFTEEIGRSGKRVGIVSRGYGGSERGPARVPTDGSLETASRFGDEPAWLAARFSGRPGQGQVPTYVGRDRYLATQTMLKENPLDVVIADDCFQHRRLSRRCDVVVLDATEPRWHYRSLPLGRMRESFSALKRADAVVLTKVNMADGAQISWLREMIASERREGEALPVFETGVRIARLAQIELPAGDPGSFSTSSLATRKFVLLSAIGRPHVFRQLIERECASQALEHFVFADHHYFTGEDLAMIERRAEALGAEDIVMTEKDAVKLRAWRPGFKCWVARLEIEAQNLRGFYELAGRLLF